LAVEDVSRDNFRIFDQYLRMNQAANLDQLVAAIEEEAALPWVNTAAVDRYGNAWYGDVGTVPHVSAAKLASCQTLLSGLVSTFGITLLDGARSECALGTDPDSAQPGILGASNLPSLRTRSWVQNSNDSYWLANPASLLEGFSPLIGRERVPQGFRTRLGIRQIDERLAGTDGLPGNRFDLAAVQNLLTGNRNLSAELALDGVLTLCDEEPNDVDLGGQTIDVSGACAVLRAWDRRNDTTSVGTHVWRRVWDRLNDLSDPWVVPFDPDDAANTPAVLNLLDPQVRSVGMEALATAVEAWAGDGIALDAPWGAVHFDVKNGVEIPSPGGPGSHGVYNAIGTRFAAGSGYTPVTSGSSIVMAISFDRTKPVAKGMLTYSQSTDPTSPFYSDQTSELFSREAWNDLPYTYKEILADRLSIQKINEAR
jgi:acyl-homoserine-lactone acylase